MLTSYPEPVDRNVVVNELGYILDLVWDEINESDLDAQFLADCYIPPVSSDDALTLAKELLDLHRKADELASQEALTPELVPTLVRDYAADKPVIVLGNVGHGKSTFLKYLRLVADKSKLEKYIQIDIDFLDRPDNPDDVGRYINSIVENELLNNYSIDIFDDSVVRACLRSGLARFKKSPAAVALADDNRAYKMAELDHIKSLQADRHSYLARVFDHLKKGRGHSLAIFLDNLDRRQDSIQEEAFLRASAMARDWGALIFVCLRPSTFFRSRNEGVLDAVAPKTITIVSPKTSVLLKKRFQYARRFAEGETVVRRQALRGPFGRNVTLDLPRVAELLGCFGESFFRERKLTTVFEAVSNGNVRELLRYVKLFIIRRHLDTQKI